MKLAVYYNWYINARFIIVSLFYILVQRTLENCKEV